MLPITLGLMATTFVASGTSYGLSFVYLFVCLRRAAQVGATSIYTKQLFSSLLELPATIGAAYTWPTRDR